MYPYEVLAKQIQRKVLTGELKPGVRLDSIRKLSEKEKLSPVTVTKAIDSLVQKGYLKKEERRGIFVAGDPNGNKLKKRAGILIRHLSSAAGSSSSSLSLVQKSMARMGCFMSVHGISWHPHGTKLEYVPVDIIGSYEFDCIITVCIYDYHYLAKLSEFNVPIVAYDVDASHLGIDSVFYDNTLGAFLLTKHLIESGHTNIAFVGGPVARPFHREEAEMHMDPCAVERAEGYRMAMQTFLPEAPVHVFHSLYERNEEGTEEALKKLLDTFPECTVIVSENALNPAKFKREDIKLAYFSSSPGGEPAKECPENTAAVALCDSSLMAETAVELLELRIQDPLKPVRREPIPVKIQVL
jgi:DNA-binding LacI/PurR family transcriptional regulator